MAVALVVVAEVTLRVLGVAEVTLQVVGVEIEGVGLIGDKVDGVVGKTGRLVGGDGLMVPGDPQRDLQRGEEVAVIVEVLIEFEHGAMAAVKTAGAEVEAGVGRAGAGAGAEAGAEAGASTGLKGLAGPLDLMLYQFPQCPLLLQARVPVSLGMCPQISCWDQAMLVLELLNLPLTLANRRSLCNRIVRVF